MSRTKTKTKTRTIIITAALLAVPCTAQAANVTGNVKFPLSLGFGGAKELIIREPEMCAGSADAKVTWNQNQDRVRVKLDLDGIPYEPSYCFEFDPSTPYNEYPLCVEDGVWQMWLATRFFARTSVWYYDSVSGDLIGNEHDLLAGPPPGSIPFELPALQMMCMGEFRRTESSPPAELRTPCPLSRHRARRRCRTAADPSPPRLSLLSPPPGSPCPPGPAS